MKYNNKLFDTHVHINTKPFIDDIENVMKQAKEQNVEKMLCIGFDMESSLKAIDLAYRYPERVYAAIGLHPTEVNDISQDDMDRFENMLHEPCVVALGEIGLDYHWDTVKPNIQKEYFIKQIRLAKKVNLPIIIHSRDAIQDTFDILKAEDIKSIGGIMHSYSGSLEMAKEFIKLNMLISLSGVVTFKNAKSTKMVAQNIPLDKLLIETDCPYLTPVPYRGQTNYPWYVKYVAQEIADIKEISYEEVCNTTFKNALKIFKIEEV
ncbi:TatD family hydrolase [Mycoplasma sp. P36-A1]|uniref:TatD family hydrolase n=1 Tax=Mycoplasma sp. P36-A1 TaxID=3252900 RepID=UPI003C2D0824